MADPFNIESITVKNDRIVCVVCVEKSYAAYTDKELMDRVLSQFPRLGEHTCKNAVGNTFASVMYNTSIPHLFEHLVIDIQVRDSAQSSKTFVGTTEWLDEMKQQAQVEVSFTDDLDALRAFCEAKQILNAAMI